jgi:hypothetical protein
MMSIDSGPIETCSTEECRLPGKLERTLSTRSIIALYSSLAPAELAERDLVAAGVAPHDITLAARSATFGETVTASHDDSVDAERQEGRYFDWLIGARVPETRVRRYRALLGGGAALLCVRVGEEAVDEVRWILRRHEPLDRGDPAWNAVDPAYAGSKPRNLGLGDLDEYLLDPSPGDDEGEFSS